MKILLAVHGYPPTFNAGAERAAERMAHWMVERGHRVDVFARESLDASSTRVETRVESGVIVHRLYSDIRSGDRFQNLYDDPAVGLAFRGLLEANRYDLVHVVSGYLLAGPVIAAAKVAGLPIVLTLTEFWFLCYNLNLLTTRGELCDGPDTDDKCMRCVQEERRRFKWPAQRFPTAVDGFWRVAASAPFARTQTAAVRRRRMALHHAASSADLIICPSRFLMEKFQEHRFPMDRAIHRPYGIRHPPAVVRERPRQRQAGSMLRLGYVGQIKSHKGVDVLVDAVVPLVDSNAPLTLDIHGPLSGDADYSAALRQQTAGRAAIAWRGPYGGDGVWNVLAGIDALVVPSRWYENTPTVILEAFAMGVPVVAANLGSMPELVRHGQSGLLFDNGDSADLRAQIRRLMEEPDLLPRLRSGIPRVSTIDDEMTALLGDYERLVSRRLPLAVEHYA